MKVNNSAIKKIRDAIDALNRQIGDAENKKTKAEKMVHPTYNKLDLLEKGIKELERKIQVTSTDAKDERKIIKEMQFIKESKPHLEELEVLRQFIFDKKREKKQVGMGLKDLKEEKNVLQKRINELKKTQEQAQETREQIQKQLDKINADRNALREQITELRGQKDKLREDYYKRLLAYEKQQIVLRDIEFLQGLKTRALEREENRIKWEEEKARREEERKKKIEEAERREEARRRREEERLKEEEDRQRKWEESQL
jgi:phage-related tail protein